MRAFDEWNQDELREAWIEKNRAEKRRHAVERDWRGGSSARPQTEATMHNPALRKRVHALRAEGHTHQSIADLIGYSRGTVEGLLRGYIPPARQAVKATRPGVRTVSKRTAPAGHSGSEGVMVNIALPAEPWEAQQ